MNARRDRKDLDLDESDAELRDESDAELREKPPAELDSREERPAKLDPEIEAARKRTERICQEGIDRIERFMAKMEDLEVEAQKVRDALAASAREFTRELTGEVEASKATAETTAGTPRRITASGKPPEHPRRRNAQTARRSPSLGAKLLAVQMSVAGADRADIEERLRTEFGIDDPADVVDDI